MTHICHEYTSATKIPKNYATHSVFRWQHCELSAVLLLCMTMPLFVTIIMKADCPKPIPNYLGTYT